MTYEEIKQQLKNEALNKILFVHSKYCKYGKSSYGEDYVSVPEQRDYQVKIITDKLERDLDELKIKYKNK